MRGARGRAVAQELAGHAPRALAHGGRHRRLGLLEVEHDLRRAQYVRQRRPGKHVLMEKPPALNEAQMRRITEAGHKAGRLLLVGSQSVYGGAFQDLRGRIAGGELGEIYLVHVRECERRGTPHGYLRVKALAEGARKAGLEF